MLHPLHHTAPSPFLMTRFNRKLESLTKNGMKLHITRQSERNFDQRLDIFSLQLPWKQP